MNHHYCKPLFFCCILVLLGCTHTDTSQKTKPGIIHSVTLGGYITCDSVNYLFLKSNLLNTTGDTMTCVRMMCPTWSAYTLESGDLQFAQEYCYINGAQQTVIPPHQSTDLFLKITSPKAIGEWKQIHFRVGFNCILRDTSKNLFTQAEESGNMKNVVWSDTVHLSKFWLQ